MNRSCQLRRDGRIFRLSTPLMSRLFRPTTLAWLALVALSAGWVALAGSRRIEQIRQTSDQAPVAAVDESSPTGYTDGTRGLLLPLGALPAQARLMDVQAMSAAGRWSIAHASYDNAPEGRPVHGPAPYRWWLRAVAMFEPGPGGRAVEQAALHADPALHLLAVLGAGAFAAWRFGAVAGGLLALGTAALLAHTRVFAPGQPDDHGLFLTVNLLALLLLLAGWKEPQARATRLWFALAGLAGGLGLWLDAGSQLAILGALGAGGLVVTVVTSRSAASAPAPLPWRTWAIAGAIASSAGWFLEGRPGGWSGTGLALNHPLMSLAWLGAAEVLARLQHRSWSQAGPTDRLSIAGLGVVVLAPLAWLYIRGSGVQPFGPAHPALAGGGGLIGWLRSDGVSLGVVAALLPTLLLPAAWLVGHGAPEHRPGLLFAATGSAVLLIIGLWQIRWWGLVDVGLLGLLTIVAAASPAGFAAIGWRSGIGLLFLPALMAAWPRPSADATLAPQEARALVERDLAQWLAARSEPGAIALAPPALSGSLAYYGGLRVVASPYPGNPDGLALAARIAGVTSTDEAQALVQRRGIQYIVLPSWDDALDRLAQPASPAPERSLVALLRQWLPPRWLRPVPYQLPVIPGLERDSLAVFEVVEPQENVLALSRLASYFVETGRLDLAAAVGDSLAQAFSTDAGAMISRAQVALARGEGRTLARVMEELLPATAEGKDEDLPWERRANLAIVLAQAKRPELARPQVEYCLTEADLERLRSLGPVSLFRLLTLARAFRLEFSAPQLRESALALLPVEFQAQLRQ